VPLLHLTPLTALVQLLEANQALREKVQALQLSNSGANKRKAEGPADAEGDSPGSRAKRAAEA
jgi:hypothetical protein